MDLVAWLVEVYNDQQALLWLAGRPWSLFPRQDIIHYSHLLLSVKNVGSSTDLQTLHGVVHVCSPCNLALLHTEATPETEEVMYRWDSLFDQRSFLILILLRKNVCQECIS